MSTMEGNVAVFIRLEGESPVTVLPDAQTEVSHVRVFAVPSLSSLEQVMAEKLSEADVFDNVVAFNDDNSALASELSAIAAHLKTGGGLQLYVADVTDESKSAVLMALMIGGFVDAAVDPNVTEYPGLPNAALFTSTKPAFESGSSAAIAVNKGETKTAQPLKKWAVVADDFDEDDDIIDEDSLLDDTNEVLQAAKDDCEVGKDGKRRACKDCTCGRKDELDQPVVSTEDLKEMVSSCGNCFKGDAFRCGSCPYLGKPAFKPGMEKVMLNLDDADDI